MPVKITPTAGAAVGHPFTVIDTPDARLVEGTVALFGDKDAPLGTNPPHRTARGVVPLVPPGTYTVTVVTPNGTRVAMANTFQVRGAISDATASPSEGPAGTRFTIDDPQARIQTGSTAVFFPLGEDPVRGTPADNNAVVSAAQLTGNVPAIPAGEYQLGVREPTAGTLLFSIRFRVT